MSKQRLENHIKRLKKNMEELRPDVHNEILKQCLINGKTPKDPKLKELVRLFEDSYYVGLCAKTLPTMPSDKWMKDNGTVCQPLDWVDDAFILEPDNSKKIRPRILKRNAVK